MNRLSSLHSVERILQSEGGLELTERYGRPLTLDAIRQALDEARGDLKAEPAAMSPELKVIISQAEAHLSAWTTASLKPVINATGVILHTNLGRAPLSKATLVAMDAAARGYSNLEFDLETGKRGERWIHSETALLALTGAEAALVVNNNASAVLLVLCALAARKRVVIARSQLVEIGGGFRMPEVMKQSGARLVEVGTTNKVRLADYEAELSKAALVMRAHRSNFKMIGFTEEPELADIVRAAHGSGVVVVDDLGSGALLDTSKYGMAHEPTVQESQAAGCDVVCFSGDKLLGGPQAGIIIGKTEVIKKLRKHPMARAVRADKTCLAGTAATLHHYLRNEAERQIPVWQMISMPIEAIRGRAAEWAESLGLGEVQASQSALGGGSLPGETIPTQVLSIRVDSPDRFLKKLRDQDPPIIARAEKGRVLLDPRTVPVEQDSVLVHNLRAAFSESR
jgi:L-seryl-tRNA(Ser) seleniumtransferase